MRKRSRIVFLWLFALGAIIYLPSIALAEKRKPKAMLPSNKHTLLPPQKVKIPEDIPFCFIRQGPWHLKRAPYTGDKLLRDLQAGKELPPLRPMIVHSTYLRGYFDGWQYRIAEIIGTIKEEKIKPWEISRSCDMEGYAYDRGRQTGYFDCQARTKSLKRELTEDQFRQMARACYLPDKEFLGSLHPPKPPSFNPLGPKPSCTKRMPTENNDE